MLLSPSPAGEKSAFSRRKPKFSESGSCDGLCPANKAGGIRASSRALPGVTENGHTIPSPKVLEKRHTGTKKGEEHFTFTFYEMAEKDLNLDFNRERTVSKGHPSLKESLFLPPPRGSPVK